jgi:hypothetical protein
MLSAILPQRNGARVQIPSGDCEMKRMIEAYSFFPEYDDRRTLTLRRIGPDEALIEARAERAQLAPALAARIRAGLRTLAD